MKTMKQMHDKILSEARWDGGWPRAVIVGPGIIALARDQAHYDALRMDAAHGALYGLLAGLALGAVIIYGTANL